MLFLGIGDVPYIENHCEKSIYQKGLYCVLFYDILCIERERGRIKMENKFLFTEASLDVKRDYLAHLANPETQERGIDKMEVLCEVLTNYVEMLAYSQFMMSQKFDLINGLKSEPITDLS